MITLSQLIEQECKRSGSAYFHKSEFERIIKAYLNQKRKPIKEIKNDEQNTFRNNK